VHECGASKWTQSPQWLAVRDMSSYPASALPILGSPNVAQEASPRAPAAPPIDTVRNLLRVDAAGSIFFMIKLLSVTFAGLETVLAPASPDKIPYYLFRSI
jgi:hypothetical protein